MARVIRAVQFEVESLTLTYMDDVNDVRAEGAIYQMHTIAMARDKGLDEEIAAVEESLDALLAAGVLAWATSVPFDVNARLQKGHPSLEEDDDQDDDAE